MLLLGRYLGMFILVVAFLGATTCCAPTAGRPREMAPSDVAMLDPAAILTLHADTTFTGPERDAIEEATARLNGQTRGLLHVDVVFDVDFDSVMSILKHREDDLLLRITSAAPMVEEIEADWPRNVHLLGVTFNQDRTPDSETIYLVADRLPNRRFWVSVTMHEILHALQIPHVDNRGALMAPSVSSLESAPVCLHKADVRAICEVYSCRPERLGWCR